MTEIFANWTKIILGICALVLLTSYAFGRISTDDMVKLLAAVSALHPLISGLAAAAGGPTRNDEITHANIIKAVESPPTSQK
jgi:hypothetical protein